MYGVGAFNRQPAYGVSKAGINMLTEYVATAFGKKGVRCNAVAPSMISTPLLRSFIPEELVKLNEDATLTPFLGEPEDIAAIVAFLASDDARRSEEHTSELQSLMRISYAVFCLKKKTNAKSNI